MSPPDFDSKWALLSDFDNWDEFCLGAGMVLLSFAARQTAQGVAPSLAVDLAVAGMVQTMTRHGIPKDLTDGFRNRFFGYERIMCELLTTIHTPFERKH